MTYSEHLQWLSKHEKLLGPSTTELGSSMPPCKVTSAITSERGPSLSQYATENSEDPENFAFL